jgi:hypothetical protein
MKRALPLGEHIADEEQAAKALECELEKVLCTRGLTKSGGKAAAGVVEETLETMAKRLARTGETMEQAYSRLWAELSPSGDEFRALLQIRDQVAR